MKHRSLGKMFLLFIVTLGIYRLVWLAKTRREMMAQKTVKIPSVWLLIVPFLLVILSLGILVFSVATAAVDADAKCQTSLSSYQSKDDCVAKNTEEMSGFQVVALIATYLSLLALMPLTAWWLWYYCKAVEEVTHAKLQFPLAMIVLVLVPDGIDMLIVQDTFNKIATEAVPSVA